MSYFVSDMTVDIGTEWNLKTKEELGTSDNWTVDIGTEWNLKTHKGQTLDREMLVDIGTEWNLKLFYFRKEPCSTGR